MGWENGPLWARQELSTTVRCGHLGASDPSEGCESKKRRFWRVAEKRRIIDEMLEPGAPVGRVARAHGVNAIRESSWTRQYRQEAGWWAWGDGESATRAGDRDDG